MKSPLAELRFMGLKLRLDPETRSIKVGPKERITDDLRTLMHQEKERIIEELEDEALEDTGIIQSKRQVLKVYQEWESAQ